VGLLIVLGIFQDKEVDQKSSSLKRRKSRTPKGINLTTTETPRAASTSKEKIVKRKLKFAKETDTLNSRKIILYIPYSDSDLEEDQTWKNQNVEDPFLGDLSPHPNPIDKRIKRLKDNTRVYKVLYQQMKAENEEIKDNFPKAMK